MRRRPQAHAHVGELNIVPYLDIMVNLVMFMLMNIAGFITYSAINARSVGLVEATSTDPPPPIAAFNVAISLGADGYRVESGADLSVIPRDPEALARHLREVKRSHPEVSGCTISAGAGVPYRDIIATMDAARADAQGPLFPEVLFGRVEPAVR